MISIPSKQLLFSSVHVPSDTTGKLLHGSYSIRFLFLTEIPIHEITHHADKAAGCHVALDAYKHNVAAVSILSCVVYMHVLPNDTY